jgi:hypothetical protein
MQIKTFKRKIVWFKSKLKQSENKDFYYIFNSSLLNQTIDKLSKNYKFRFKSYSIEQYIDFYDRIQVSFMFTDNDFNKSNFFTNPTKLVFEIKKNKETIFKVWCPINH